MLKFNPAGGSVSRKGQWTPNHFRTLILHHVMCHGISLWPAQVSCPDSIPFQLLRPFTVNGLALASNYKHWCVISFVFLLELKHQTLKKTIASQLKLRHMVREQLCHHPLPQTALFLFCLTWFTFRLHREKLWGVLTYNSCRKPWEGHRCYSDQKSIPSNGTELLSGGPHSSQCAKQKRQEWNDAFSLGSEHWSGRGTHQD